MNPWLRLSLGQHLNISPAVLLHCEVSPTNKKICFLYSLVCKVLKLNMNLFKMMKESSGKESCSHEHELRPSGLGRIYLLPQKKKKETINFPENFIKGDNVFYSMPLLCPTSSSAKCVFMKLNSFRSST